MKKRKITQACKCFFETTKHIDNFFAHVIFTTKRIDEMRLHAVQALAQIHEKELKPEDMQEVAMDCLNQYVGLLLEMWLCRIVECYQNYLSSILKDVFYCCPDVLKSGEMIKLDEILRYSRMDDFIRELSERKVSSLSYSSFDDLFNFFDKKLGIKITDEANKNLIREAIETRNISIHNNCIINRRYITKLRESEELIGHKKKIKKEFLATIIDITHRNVLDIDSKLIKKFKIKNCENIELLDEEIVN